MAEALPRRPPPPTIYRSAAGEAAIRALYDKALAALPYEHAERLVETSFGTAHVLVCGPADAPPLMLWSGFGVPAPFMVRMCDPLLERQPFRVYVTDFPCQGNAISESTRHPLADRLRTHSFLPACLLQRGAGPRMQSWILPSTSMESGL